MADTVKKAATPRKPRAAKAIVDSAALASPKPVAQKKAASRAKVTPIKAVNGSGITHDQIAALAHRFWLERGGQHGHDADDWIRAEHALLGKAG